tara:strand:- start:6912 stop:8456 length:1545 start_codon:yes stop_codon:yes gene_type:complete
MGLFTQEHQRYYTKTQTLNQQASGLTQLSTFDLLNPLPPTTNDPTINSYNTDMVVKVNGTVIANTNYSYIKGTPQIVFGRKRIARRTSVGKQLTATGGTYATTTFPNVPVTPGDVAGSVITLAAENTIIQVGDVIAIDSVANSSNHDVTSSSAGDGTKVAATENITIYKIADDNVTITLNKPVRIENSMYLYTFKYDWISNIADITTTNWSVAHIPNTQVSSQVPPGAKIEIINSHNNETGNYQNISLKEIINNFMVSYVGQDKLINKIKRSDVAFHARRAQQELSYDTYRSSKSQEIEIPASLTMLLPHDYVNYVKLSYSDASGIEHVLYPTSITGNPSAITQDANGAYTYNTDGSLVTTDSNTWASFQTLSANQTNKDDYNYDNDLFDNSLGERYGLNPVQMQVNGSFFIDSLKGNIHFSSNLLGKTVTLKYLSDSMGTLEEMVVHKFAEEAMYKCIAYAVLCGRANVQEYIVRRFKKDRFAAVRNAKLRLSNLKLEELTQVMRGKSKQIKH